MAFNWFSFPTNFSRTPSMIYIMSQGGVEVFGRTVLFMELLAECSDGFDPANKMMLAVLASKIGMKKTDKVKQFLELLTSTEEFKTDEAGKIHSQTVSNSKTIFNLQVDGGKKGQEVKKHGKKMLGDLQGDLKVTQRLLEDTTIHNITLHDTTSQTNTHTTTNNNTSVDTYEAKTLATHEPNIRTEKSIETKRKLYLNQKLASGDGRDWNIIKEEAIDKFPFTDDRVPD